MISQRLPIWANHGAAANRLSAVRSSVAEVRERTVRSTGAAEAVAEQRDSAMPFAEDDCVSSFGYWTDEDWADAVIVVEASQQPDPKWLTAIDFMPGAVIAVQAASAHAQIGV